VKLRWFIALIPFLTSCAYVSPYVQDFNIISVEEEKQLSEKLAPEIAKEMTIIDDSGPNRQVRRIGDRLVKTLPERDFDYRFYVVKDKTPNAFTIPGGRIYVHTGLLDFASDDDELAGVLAHEIGHAVERHPTKNLSRAYGIQYLTSILLGKNHGKLQTVVLGIAQHGVLTKYGRDDEREADDIGFYLLKDAGYPTDGLLRFLRKLQKLQGGSSPLAFLSTHPPTPERIARLESMERDAKIDTSPASYDGV